MSCIVPQSNDVINEGVDQEKREHDIEHVTDTSGAEQNIEIFSNELKIIKGFKQPTFETLKSLQVFLGEKAKKYTLVLDLDQTLVYTQSEEAKDHLSFCFKVLIRPYARALLEKLSQKYEIVIFTAADERYAKEIIKQLDPHGHFISALLASQYCIVQENGILVKDLRIFGDRKIEEMLIVDNSIYSFAFQIGNGIPVTSYEGSQDDEELSFLIEYLEDLYNDGNIVQTNASKIGLLAQI